MKNELQELKVQNKKLQLSYDDLLFLATSAPSGDELEVPDDLNFLSNSSHDEVRELENYSRCSPLVSFLTASQRRVCMLHTCSPMNMHIM